MPELSVQLDIFAIIILLGVIQGVFLSFFFLNKKIRQKPSNLYLGLIMLFLSLIILEIFLNYTGYMIKVLRIDNFSEPLSFGVAPLMYLYIYSTISKRLPKRAWLHMIPMIFWFVYCILYYIQPVELKYPHYISYHYPDTVVTIPDKPYNVDPLSLRKYVNELLMFQLTIYLVASLILVRKAFKLLQIPFFASNIKPLSWLRTFILLVFCILISLVVVKSVFVADIGDYIIASLISVVIYATSFNVVKASDFFQENIADPLNPRKKYVKSTLQEEEKLVILEQLKKCMEIDKDFKNNLVSLPYISKKLALPVHHISQVINEKLNQSFFEMIASYRIEEAKKILLDKTKDHLTIEDIADEVGYNSKSAFNRSFKKHSGTTPSEFRANHSNN